MKRRMQKTLTAVAITAAAMSMMVVPAAAAKKTSTYYTPKQTVAYREQDGKWVKWYSRTETYKKGNLVKSVSTYFTDEGAAESTSKSVYSYKGGVQKSSKSYSNNRLTSQTKNKFKKGVLKTSTRISYGSDNTPTTYVETYKYKNGRRVSTTTKKNGKPYSKTTYKYKNGLSVGTTTKYADGSTSVSKSTYKKNRIVKSTYSSVEANGDRYDSSTTYTGYDKHGNFTKSVNTWSNKSADYSYNQKQTTTYSYKYDKKTKAIKEEVSRNVDEDGDSYAYKYVYSKFMKQTVVVR